ncbi:MAG: archease [Verrucomicrobiae bacterium]|nr:archease [Verrucomicrobiae bacterium]
METSDQLRQKAGLRYEYFEHTADIGVAVYGRTLTELFCNGAAALYETMGRWEAAQVARERVLALEAGTLDDLWHDWLAELLFDFAAHDVVYRQFEFRQLDLQRLEAALHGSCVDWGRSEPGTEIKAVTYHRLQVKQRNDGLWVATVVFDV